MREATSHIYGIRIKIRMESILCSSRSSSSVSSRTQYLKPSTQGKVIIKAMRLRVGWDEAYLAELLLQSYAITITFDFRLRSSYN